MRVLVTGASGAIGSALCDSLLARGDEVVGLSRDPAKARNTNPTVSWHGWDPANERPPAQALAGVDAVVNLIGEEVNQRLTAEAKERIHDSRVRVTHNLVDGMLAASPSPPVLVSQAAIGIYGDHGEAIVDESSALGEGFLAKVVIEWENEARRAESGGVRVVVVRTGLYLDPDTGLLKQLIPPFKFGVGGALAGGNFYMPWIHRDDEIGILLFALDNANVSGTINATAPHPVTNREFSKALGKALHRPSLIPAPRFAIVALRGGELAGEITGSYRVVPRRVLDLGYSFRFSEIESALRDLLEK